jgi:hypothetical protein
MILKPYFLPCHNQWAKNTITVKLEKTEEVVITPQLLYHLGNAQKLATTETVHSFLDGQVLTHITLRP